MSSRPRSFRSRAARPLLLPVALIALALLGEGAARIVDHVRGTDSSQSPPQDPDQSVIVPHPYVGYIPRPSFSASPPGAKHSFTHNAQGFRGPEIETPKSPRTFRVACIGGSTTQGLRSESDHETWPARLQAHLQAALPPDGPFDRVECLNGGAGGYTSLESFISLKTRLLPLDLDLVVDYDAPNDAQLILRAGFKPDYSNVRQSWTPPPERAWADRLFGWSHLYGSFLSPERRRSAVSIRDLLFVPDYETLPFAGMATLGPAFENFYWTLREIVSIARAHRVPTILCTFAWPRTGKYEPSEADLRRGYIAVVKQLNACIRAAAEEERVTLVDLERTGPVASEQYVDPIHPNAAGYDAIARRIADAVIGQGLLGRPAPPRPVPHSVHGNARPRSSPIPLGTGVMSR